MPYKPKYTITPKINKALVEIERVRGFLDAINLKDDWVSDMQAKALLLESHHSTHIEGTAINLEQAQDILAGKKVKGVSRDDEKELLNYKKAMDFISKYLGKDDPISEGLVRELHKILVRGVRGSEAQPGSYRKIQNYVANSRTKEIIYTPPAPLEVPHLMREFVDWINGNIEEVSPVLTAGIAQFQFVHIHPFVDGNGRTARLLSTLILYKTGYDFKRLFTISEYYDKDRPAYYTAIQSVRKSKMDMTGWLEYFVDGLRSQMKEIQGKGKKIITADKVVKRFEDNGLNDRQAKIIRYLVVNAKITNDECQKLCGSIRRTATRDLSSLVEKGIVEMKGELKGAYYVLSPTVKI
jgi:Fic family protein